MGIVPERNDVDISKLFKWSQEFEIEDLNGELLEKVYIRIIGDADMNRARVMALRHAAELRRKLKDLDSDERLAYIAQPGDLERETLVGVVLLSKTRGIYTKIAKETVVPFPKELKGDATQEQQEQWQAEVDQYPVKIKEAIDKAVNKVVDKERKEVEKLNDNDLYNAYVSAIINDTCENEMYDRFIELCTFFGTFSDPELKQKRFESLDEFENLPKRIKEQYVIHYRELELDMNEVKK